MFIIFSTYNQIKNVAYFVNKQNPHENPLPAMFYTRFYLLALFRKLASVGVKAVLNL
jgi:hypothetical protein